MNCKYDSLAAKALSNCKRDVLIEQQLCGHLRALLSGSSVCPQRLLNLVRMNPANNSGRQRPARGEPEGVAAEVELTSNNPGLQLSGAIAAVAKPLKDGPEVRQEEDVHTGVGPAP